MLLLWQICSKRCITLKLEIEVMVYVRSIREADFLFYIEVLANIVPWIFALGHTHYARWISVHLRDMITLKDTHPDVHGQFLKGIFAVKKTTHTFSAIAIDHEQNNKLVPNQTSWAVWKSWFLHKRIHHTPQYRSSSMMGILS